MLKKFILLVILLLFATPSWGNNVLIYAEPWGNEVTFYRITVNGIELEEDIPAKEEFDWVFFFNLKKLNLPDGVHSIWIRACSETDESDDVKFKLAIKSFRKYKQYAIKLVQKNVKEDPYYATRFDEPLVVRIPY